MLVELFVPKHLTTDLIDCDVNPTYIRFVVKEKVTQLRLPEEIEVDKSKVERSKTTGCVLVTCPTVYKRPKNTEEAKKQREELKKQKKLADLEKEMKNKEYLKGIANLTPGQKESHKIVNKADEKPKEEPQPEEEPYVPDFDLDELPPLE